jgi:steroid 5-alpha reductase family enzyme
LDKIGLFIVLFGITYETIADKQLKKFLSKKSNKVMDQGLWHYSRHPNYFGEFLVWWGFYLISIGSGYWFTIISPILMSILLLKVSGAELLESTIVNRRPGYKSYIKNTSAFFPWPSKK